MESLQSLRRTAELGVPAPLYAGAASKVLLAGMKDDEIESYLDRTPLKPIQDATVTERGELWQQIREIREGGYSESLGEVLVGGGSVAAPIKSYDGQTVAAIDILTPSDRYTPEHRARCIDLLLAAAQQASERLGFRGASG